MSRSKVLIEKINARVFCQSAKGGNPVTIFSCAESPLLSSSSSSSWQSRLAQSCAWESVIVDKQSKTMAFYMPTGEQVSFCAHAAMGGAATALLNSPGENAVSFSAAMEPEHLYTASTVEADDTKPDDDDDDDDDDFADDNDESSSESKVISLQFTDRDFTEERVFHPPALYRILREFFGLTNDDLYIHPVLFLMYPTFCNISIARPKTLVYVNSQERLHSLQLAQFSTEENFRHACDALQSTGIYFYTEANDSMNFHETQGKTTLSWQCRQFPRASGYPEDPATGIAAAAFAVSLAARTSKSTIECFQGFAMGKPSLITVQDVKVDLENIAPITSPVLTRYADDESGYEKYGATPKPSITSTTKKGKASFRLLGQVQVDDYETLEVSLDD